MHGTIDTVHADKGYGFIRGADGRQYFFHQSALRDTRIAELERGAPVTFEDAEGSRGLRADDVWRDA